MLRWAFLAALTCACITLLPADLPAGQAEQDFVQYSASPRVRVVPDLVYARYGKRALLLDLYLPMNPAKRAFPGVIVVRGGGWMVNDRKRFAHIASALAERGLAAASIEYRNADEAAFPGAIQDVKAVQCVGCARIRERTELIPRRLPHSADRPVHRWHCWRD